MKIWIGHFILKLPAGCLKFFSRTICVVVMEKVQVILIKNYSFALH